MPACPRPSFVSHSQLQHIPCVPQWGSFPLKRSVRIVGYSETIPNRPITGINRRFPRFPQAGGLACFRELDEWSTRLTGGPEVNRLIKKNQVDGLGKVIVHPGFQASVSVAFHRISCQGDDRHAPC